MQLYERKFKNYLNEENLRGIDKSIYRNSKIDRNPIGKAFIENNDELHQVMKDYFKGLIDAGKDVRGDILGHFKAALPEKANEFQEAFDFIKSQSPTPPDYRDYDATEKYAETALKNGIVTSIQSHFNGWSQIKDAYQEKAISDNPQVFDITL